MVVTAISPVTLGQSLYDFLRSLAERLADNGEHLRASYVKSIADGWYNAAMFTIGSPEEQQRQQQEDSQGWEGFRFLHCTPTFAITQRDNGAIFWDFCYPGADTKNYDGLVFVASETLPGVYESDEEVESGMAHAVFDCAMYLATKPLEHE